MAYWCIMALAIGLLLSALGGCANRTLIASEPLKPNLVDADHSLTKDCEDPVAIPERALTQLEVETMWSADRKNLKLCKISKRGVVTYYKTRDAGLRDNWGSK